MNDPTSLWQETVATAIVGTARRAPEPNPAGGALGQVLEALPAATLEQKLLGTAATLALYRRAGQLPTLGPASPAPAEPETQLRCRPAAAARLGTMLAGLYSDLLPEWFALAEGQRVPEELLPDVLDWSQKHLDQLEHILPVLGARGRWLAAYRPSWRAIAVAALADRATPETLTAHWHTGDRASRKLLLARLRLYNLALARELVASTWAEDGAEERLVFLQTFPTGLSMEDEPFLETALDDRAKDVRRAAAELLAHLSASRLVQRQIARGQMFLHWNSGRLLRKAQIEVTLPENCDKEMQRDGAEPKPPRGQQTGEKAWWLEQILGAVPPATWSQAWDKSPTEILDAATRGDWQDMLYKSWVMATVRFRDAAWAEAFIQRSVARPLLLEILPALNREALLLTHLQNNPQEGMLMLLAYVHPWSEKLSRLALQQMQNHFLQGDKTRPELQLSIQKIGRCLEPSLSAEAVRMLPVESGTTPAWERAVQTLLQTLEFRRAMREELTR